MSKGYPSMTALLGLLAVAGYQNRDKIAEWLGTPARDAHGSVVPPVGDDVAVRVVRGQYEAGFVGGREESALLKALLAPGLGVTADDVPDLGVLLVGPMARGAEVSLR